MNNKLKILFWSLMGVIGMGILGSSYFGGSDIALVEVQEYKIQTKQSPTHKFIDSKGNIITVETTLDSYKAIDVKKGKIPVYPDAEWVGSSSNEPIYETVTPILKDYEFIRISSSTVKLKLPTEEKIVDDSYVLDEKLTPFELGAIK